LIIFGTISQGKQRQESGERHFTLSPATERSHGDRMIRIGCPDKPDLK
jgi:hypothetical protein